MPVHRTGFSLPIDELRDELDRLWTSLVTAPPLHGWGSRPGQGVFPAVNVREADDSISVEAELPGIDPASIDVSVSGEELVLKGSRSDGLPAHAASSGAGCHGGSCPAPGNESAGKTVWHLRERGSGAFERRITLPVPVDAGRVEARLTDGVLTIHCPKLAECRPRKVEVRGG